MSKLGPSVHSIGRPLIQELDRRIEAQDKAKASLARKKKRTLEYLNAEQEFRLYCGDVPVTDEWVVMTGLEARHKNKQLEEDFIRELDKNPKARMFAWHTRKYHTPAERNRYNKLKNLKIQIDLAKTYTSKGRFRKK